MFGGYVEGETTPDIVAAPLPPSCLPADTPLILKWDCIGRDERVELDGASCVRIATVSLNDDDGGRGLSLKRNSEVFYGLIFGGMQGSTYEATNRLCSISLNRTATTVGDGVEKFGIDATVTTLLEHDPGATNAPCPRWRHAASATPTTMFVFGGTDKDNKPCMTYGGSTSTLGDGRR